MDNNTDIFLTWNNVPEEDEDNQCQYKSILVQDPSGKSNSNIKTGDGYYVASLLALIVVALLFCLVSYFLKRLNN